MSPDLIILLPRLTTMVFVFAVGACVGSLTNVLVYRMPRGLGVVTPPSRCPWCGKVLTWRENIPIFGWLILRGRCRFCTAPISPEYPIVETIVASLFGGLYALWYVVPSGWAVAAWRPEWAMNGAAITWPAFVVLVILVGSLVAMTIIDARTFTIPLALTWTPALVALVFHVGHAVWMQAAHGDLHQMLPGQWRFADGTPWDSAKGWVWTIATPGPGGWRWIGAAIGGTVGLGCSLVLMRLGLIRRSFADYGEWERGELDRIADEHRAVADPAKAPPVPGGVGEGAGEGSAERQAEGPADDPAMWIRYPHARREMIKELAFLAPPAGLAMVGAWAAVALVTHFAGPWTYSATTGQAIAPAAAPLWLLVLSGVLLGYLIGGGVVWAVRIGGSLAFGKEAMGLGDVHLMAAVGACLGWADPTIAFFAAAFVGVGYAAGGLVMLRRVPRAMPYGPFLAIATMLVVVCKPAFEWGLSRLLGTPIDLP